MMYLSQASIDSLRKIISTYQSDRPGLEVWDRTGTLELRGLVKEYWTCEGRRHHPTPEGYQWIREYDAEQAKQQKHADASKKRAERKAKKLNEKLLAEVRDLTK